MEEHYTAKLKNSENELTTTKKTLEDMGKQLGELQEEYARMQGLMTSMETDSTQK
jgi:hypothetical protein